ncbi:MAG: N-acetylmuramoyl-L-alanine amidase family protein [Lentisphaeria bacterium]
MRINSWKFFVPAFIIVLTGCISGNAQMRSVDVGGQKYLLLEDIAGHYGMEYTNSTAGATLSSKYSDLHFRTDNLKATLNGIDVYLSEAVARWRDKALLSQTDFNLLLDPVLRPHKIAPGRPLRRIVIDPGHGGKDEGAKSGGIEEKGIVLAIAKELADLLESAGYSVHLTRKDDTFLSLRQRQTIANQHRADLFISIHTNAVASSQVNGIETFILPPKGTSSTYSHNRQKLAKPGNSFDKLNAAVAFSVHQQTRQVTGATERGIKRAGFSVLEHLECPGILIETGFLTNPEERQKLVSRSYQKKLALGIARGIQQFNKALQRDKR